MARSFLGLIVSMSLFGYSGCGEEKSSSSTSRDVSETELESHRKNGWQALSEGYYVTAEKEAAWVLNHKPTDSQALVIAGQAAAKLEEPTQALEYYQQISKSDQSEAAQLGRVLGADLLLYEAGNLTEAERQLRAVLKTNPDFQLAHRSLAGLLQITGRRWESTPHLLKTIQAGVLDQNLLLMLGWFQGISDRRDVLELCTKEDPGNPLPWLGYARLAILENDLPQAEQYLQRVLDSDPHQLEALLLRGELLARTGTLEDFIAWQAKWPSTADSHPEAWFVRGLAAMRSQEPKSAVRCFGESVLRNPDQAQAVYQLSQALIQCQEPDRAAIFAKRANQLERLGRWQRELYSDPRQQHLLKSVAKLSEELGRKWEAWGWSRIAVAQGVEASELATLLKQDVSRWPLARTLPENNPARLVDFRSYPLPTWSPIPRKAVSSTEPPPSALEVPLTFRNDSLAAGIDFQYYNSPDPKTDGMRMLETMGGGVVVLDYNQDGWPDLYFPQGTDWPTSRKIYRDALYQNLGNGRFREVTTQAGLGDEQMSYGATAGDIDNDGFPDLFVSNIGTNRLYHNNGDGTFEDITTNAGLDQVQLWSTSCAIADLNGDFFPEIYEVNYLSGEDVLEAICSGKEGRRRVCTPSHFPAAQDQLYWNRGQGRFEAITTTSGIQREDGKGLGILVADFDQTGKLSVFVANDAVANFYFVNQTESPMKPPVFREKALLSGLAFDGQGLAQACMGIATADYDGNGLLDLFVTNFDDESNTLYKQNGPGLFADETRIAQLRDAGFPLVGFGTQFIDGELDGFPDLVVTNGHLDDFRYEGRLFRMPPQYFRNRDGKRFEVLPSGHLGEDDWFAGRYLGRGLSRLDWNRDGKEDFVVSHLDSPAALITNATETTGQSVSLRFVATNSARDAIGTIAQIRVNDRTWTNQVTTGDGYMACNQKQLIFGLGTAQQISSLEVKWPSGKNQSWNDVPLNTELLLIEGHDTVYPLPKR